MKAGDLVIHEFWGKGMIVEQQGVVDRWCVRLFEAPSSISFTKSDRMGDNNIRFCWGSQLEVISASR